MHTYMMMYMYTCGYVDINIHTCIHDVVYIYTHDDLRALYLRLNEIPRGGGLGSRPIFKKFHETYARRKWYLTTGRRFHWMVVDPIPQSLPVHFFGSRPQLPTSRDSIRRNLRREKSFGVRPQKLSCYLRNTANESEEIEHNVTHWNTRCSAMFVTRCRVQYGVFSPSHCLAHT